MRSPPESAEVSPPTPLSTDSGRLHISKPLPSVMPVDNVDHGNQSRGNGIALVMSAVLALFFISVLLVVGVTAFVFVAWSANRQAEREAVLRAEASENMRQLQQALNRMQTELADASADDEETQAARAMLRDTFGAESDAPSIAEESVANSQGN